MTHKKICVICKKQFNAKDTRKQTCSKECRSELARKFAYEQWKKKEKKKETDFRSLTFKVCPECGKRFRPNSTAVQKYCSTECKDRHAYRKKATGKEVIIARCEFCNRPYIKKTPKQRYCSDDCKKTVEEEVKKTGKPGNEKEAAYRRKITQARINCVAAEAKTAGMTYGQYVATKRNAGSILDDPQNRALIERSSNG